MGGTIGNNVARTNVTNIQNLLGIILMITQRKSTSLIAVVLVMGLTFINTVMAESISDENYGKFINTFKGIYWPLKLHKRACH